MASNQYEEFTKALGGLEEATLLAKSQVQGYTRKDGTVVKPHTDNRVAKAKVTHASLKKHPNYHPDDHAYFKDKGYKPHEIKEIWDRDAKMGKGPQAHEKAPDVVGAVTGKPQGKDTPAKGKPAGSSRVAKAKANGPTPIGAHAAALKKRIGTYHSDDDRERLTMAHDAMKAGNHDALRSHLEHADTAIRDEVLEHVHPDHWSGLGFEAFDKDKAVADHEKRHGLPSSAAAKPKPKPKRKAPAKKPAPAPSKAETPAKPTPLNAHTDRLKKRIKNYHSDDDRERLTTAHNAMKANNHDALKDSLEYADTAIRDEVLEHVHPEHWEGLGFKPLDKKKAIADHETRHGKPT